MTRFIFVTGGVVSSVGKGITVASIGRMLKSRDISVSVLKLVVGLAPSLTITLTIVPSDPSAVSL